MFTSKVQFGYPCPRGGWQEVHSSLSCPPRLEFGSNIAISLFLLHHNLGLFSCKRCEHYFSQTEMFTSNVQFGYPCPRGGGQAPNIGKQKEQLNQLVMPLPHPPMSNGNKMHS